MSILMLRFCSATCTMLFNSLTYSSTTIHKYFSHMVDNSIYKYKYVCLNCDYWNEFQFRRSKQGHLILLEIRAPNQIAEFVEEIQDDRNKRQCLSLDTSQSTFSRYSQTLVIIRRLHDGSLLKTPAFRKH
jgi:predicted DCC family thiol-disulfide oxidoreductase YuxK